MVTITVGDNGKSAHMTIRDNTVMTRLTRYLGEISLFHSAVAAIPVDVKHVVITVSAADMPTIIRDIPVTGQPSITESFISPERLKPAYPG